MLATSSLQKIFSVYTTISLKNFHKRKLSVYDYKVMFKKFFFELSDLFSFTIDETFVLTLVIKKLIVKVIYKLGACFKYCYLKIVKVCKVY